MSAGSGAVRAGTAEGRRAVTASVMAMIATRKTSDSTLPSGPYAPPVSQSAPSVTGRSSAPLKDVSSLIGKPATGPCAKFQAN